VTRLHRRLVAPPSTPHSANVAASQTSMEAPQSLHRRQGSPMLLAGPAGPAGPAVAVKTHGPVGLGLRGGAEVRTGFDDSAGRVRADEPSEAGRAGRAGRAEPDRLAAAGLGGAEVLVDEGDLGILPLDGAADDGAALAVLGAVAVGGVGGEGEEGAVQRGEEPAGVCGVDG
jgi:hypothetical protein